MLHFILSGEQKEEEDERGTESHYVPCNYSFLFVLDFSKRLFKYVQTWNWMKHVIILFRSPVARGCVNFVYADKVHLS